MADSMVGITMINRKYHLADPVILGRRDRKCVRNLRFLIIIMITLFITTACVTHSTIDEAYISLTLSRIDNSSGKMYDAYYFINMTTKAATLVYEIESSAQYAMGAVSKEKDAVFFVQRTNYLGREIDQIYKHNRNTSETVLLPIPVEAVNSLFIVESKLFFVASLLNNFELSFGYYDTEKGTLWLDENVDHDTLESVVCVSYEPITQQIYYGVISLKEDNDRLNAFYEERNTTPNSYYRRPPCVIYEYDIRGNRPKVFEVFDEISVTSFSVCENKMLVSFILSKDEKRYVHLYTDYLSDMNYEQLDTTAKYIILAPDGKGLYYLSPRPYNNSKHQANALYYYDFERKIVYELFSVDNAWISNFYLCS